MSRAGGEPGPLRQLVYGTLLRRRHREPDEIVAHLHEASTLGGVTSPESTWMGVRTPKSPLDLWIYQEIIYEIRPATIIECGTAFGGSTLFFASMCDLLGCGRVISIDVAVRPGRPQHDRITYLLGSPVAPEIVATVETLIDPEGPVLAVLNSDYRKDHVLAELELYSRFVTEGSYAIVEHTSVAGYSIGPAPAAGPMDAVEEFLRGREDFVIDREREKFPLTFNPRGYLRKIR
jgi:cephalosporin hydroxylase